MHSAITLFAVTVALALFSSCSTTRPIADNHELKVMFVSGSSNVERGRLLKPGDQLSTGTNGCVDVALLGSFLIRIKSDSQLTLTKFNQAKAGTENATEITLKLNQGCMLGLVKKLSKNSKFQIHHVESLSGVRGASFMIEANGSCSVLDGQLTFIPVLVPHGMIIESIVLKHGESLNPPDTNNLLSVVFPTPSPVINLIRDQLKDATRNCSK